ncbi:hypothetical protein BC829DRAFT_125087 [Chytridium lagenaria]|nr:hypothetical protein BC829DRAFT_125087 [Chytridium lagenaria]
MVNLNKRAPQAQATITLPTPFPSSTALPSIPSISSASSTTSSSLYPSPTNSLFRPTFPGNASGPPAFLYQSSVVNVPERGEVYLLGGTVFSKFTESTEVACNNTVYIYFPEYDTWDTAATSLPSGLCGHTSTLVNNTIWVVGGSLIVPSSDTQAKDSLSELIYALDWIVGNGQRFRHQILHLSEDLITSAFQTRLVSTYLVAGLPSSQL